MISTDPVPPIARGVMKETGLNPYVILHDYLQDSNRSHIEQKDFRQAVEKILTTARISSLDQIVLISNKNRELTDGKTDEPRDEYGPIAEETVLALGEFYNEQPKKPARKR